MVVIYSQDGIKLYPLLFTACLKNDFGESIYVFSVNTDGKIFHRHLKIVAYWMVLLFVWSVKDDGNFHPRIFSHRLKMTVEFSTVILRLQSYTWVFGNLEFIFGNLTKPPSILHFLILLNCCWKFSWLFWVRLHIFRNFFLDHCSVALGKKKKDKLQNILPKMTGNRHDLYLKRNILPNQSCAW